MGPLHDLGRGDSSPPPKGCNRLFTSAIPPWAEATGWRFCVTLTPVAVANHCSARIRGGLPVGSVEKISVPEVTTT